MKHKLPEKAVEELLRKYGLNAGDHIVGVILSEDEGDIIGHFNEEQYDDLMTFIEDNKQDNANTDGYTGLAQFKDGTCQYDILGIEETTWRDVSGYKAGNAFLRAVNALVRVGVKLNLEKNPELLAVEALH